MQREQVIKIVKEKYNLYLQVVFVLFSFAIMVFVSYLYGSRIERDHLQSSVETMFSNIEANFTSDQQEFETMLGVISETIRGKIIRGAYLKEVEDYITGITTYSRTEAQIPGFLSIFAFLPIFNGALCSGLGWDGDPEFILEERPWYKAAMEANGGIVFTEPYADIVTQEVSFTVTRCIYDDGGKLLAIVGLDVSLNRIYEFSAVNRHYGECSWMFLDRDLKIMAHPFPNYLGLPLRESGSSLRELVDDLRDGVPISGHLFIDYEGKLMSATIRQMNNGWYLCVATPMAGYYGTLQGMQWFLVALGMILSALLCVVLVRVVEAKNKALKEKNMLSSIENILTELDTMIYVTEPKTGEILFINDCMKQHYGIECDVNGQLCYMLLQNNREAKCDFCPIFKLDQESGKSIVWEEHNLVTKRYYRNTDKYIHWPDGRRVHLQHSQDITDLKEATYALDKRYKQQTLMTYIAQSFLTNHQIDVLIDEAFHMIGEFLGISQILMFRADTEKAGVYVCRNSWISPELNLPSRLGSVFKPSEAVYGLLQLQRKSKENFYFSSSDPLVRETVAPFRVSFQNYLSTGIFLGEELYAFVDYSSKDDNRQWSSDDINMVGFVSYTLTNAFHKRMVERQLISAKEFAEQANKTKTSFLTMMSHEIRTPMNAILGTAEIQLQGDVHSPETEKAFNTIYDSGNLLLNIINDILDLSKIEANKIEIVPANYNIPSLINDTIQLNYMRFESKPVTLKLIIDEDTPQMLCGDELRIKQILNNILSNAFKYTAKGTVELHVFAEAQDQMTECILIARVSDTGQGMNQEQIGKLFDEYTRFNMEANRTITGTGLGMTITKRLVDLMGGEVLVESDPGKGSVFTIRLPQKRVDSKVCGRGLAEKLQPSFFKNTSRLRKTQIVRKYMPYGSVLLVDDVSSNIYVAKGLLLPYGLKIETVSSGIAAVEKIKNGAVYDIVFMDHMMPEMDGIEATKIIRTLGYTHPVVALTANAISGQEEIFLANGFDDFVSKPIDVRDLDAVLNRLIYDKQPAEVLKAAQQEQNEKETKQQDTQMKNPSDEIKKFFVLDAENAMRVLRGVHEKIEAADQHTQGLDDAGMSACATSAHGIKSALANIGETRLSGIARSLEQAGKERDLGTITGSLPAFIGALQELIDKFKSEAEAEAAVDVPEHTHSDMVFLQEKMRAIQAASEMFYVKDARAALNELKQKRWTREINDILEEISVDILHGEFEKISSAAEKVIRMCDESPQKDV